MNAVGLLLVRIPSSRFFLHLLFFSQGLRRNFSNDQPPQESLHYDNIQESVASKPQKHAKSGEKEKDPIQNCSMDARPKGSVSFTAILVVHNVHYISGL
jgi:hypothetical protein